MYGSLGGGGILDLSFGKCGTGIEFTDISRTRLGAGAFFLKCFGSRGQGDGTGMPLGRSGGAIVGVIDFSFSGKGGGLSFAAWTRPSPLSSSSSSSSSSYLCKSLLVLVSRRPGMLMPPAPSFASSNAGSSESSSFATALKMG